MRKVTMTLSLAVLVLVGSAFWQIASWKIAAMNLKEDMRDMASQAGTRIGYLAPSSDEDLRGAIIRKAEERGIELTPEQVQVKRVDSAGKSTVYLSADYTVPVKLWLFSFELHFTPSS